VVNLLFQAGEEHALEAPVGHVDKFFVFRGFGWQQIAEVPPFLEKRLDAAELAREEPVGFLQGGGRTALGALMVDGQLDRQLRMKKVLDTDFILFAPCLFWTGLTGFT